MYKKLFYEKLMYSTLHLTAIEIQYLITIEMQWAEQKKNLKTFSVQA